MATHVQITPAEQPTRFGCFAILVLWLVASIPAIYLVNRWTGWPWGPITLLALVAAFAGAFATFLILTARTSNQRARRFDQAVLAIRERTLRLSADEARREAMRFLLDPARFQTVRSKATTSIRPDLGPELIAFFSEFELVDGPVRLSRAEIEPHGGVEPSFIRIGDPYGMGHGAIKTRPHDDRILRDELDVTIKTKEAAPTIWHYIVIESSLDLAWDGPPIPVA